VHGHARFVQFSLEIKSSQSGFGAEAMSANLEVKEELLSRMSSVDSRTGGSLVARDDVQAGCSQDTVLETSQPLLLEPVAVAPEVSLGSYVYIPKP